ncbi:hypothetical protein [Paenibacillus sacheonensis]|uniref:Uncharacterized protein n=1 Tax=Paenibacillus sacheonensis TaxID=742054 RepID=A0A7X4YST5_9BACL|nr:hypothetical protein [Paenibacillus sacheonensis]MBM7568120.1 hypothetical protein [Paenibacillus sacheonensis]NBC71878.1 hypothetical protein [Paenibacillus sacheonensis]
MNKNEITDPKQPDYQGEKKNAQEMNEAGIDYIWGSDQDELVQKQKKEQ